nr:MAG TPA: hypothetical protein [Caudoviricetes sp.]
MTAYMINRILYATHMVSRNKTSLIAGNSQ